MAIYSSNFHKKSRNNWIYPIITVVVIAIIIAVIYGYNPFKWQKEQKPAETHSAAPAEPNNQEAKPLPSTTPSEVNQPQAVVLEPNTETEKLIAKAMDCINAKPAKVIEAREILNDAVPMADKQKIEVVKGLLTQLADKWLFSQSIFAEDSLCGSYTVKSGDMLTEIAGNYKVPWEILAQINNIENPQNLQAGQRIKVIYGPFHAKVYRSEFIMDIYLQNTYVKSLPVGLGKPGMETPTGLWLAEPSGKLVKPIWTDPITQRTYKPEDPDYPLGSRWIALEGIEGNAKGRTGFAIHGTKDPNGIGTQSSQGCIRLHNGDAILVYNLLEPGLSYVRVAE